MVMVIIIMIMMLMLQAMNQLSAETTVDARSFMVYVERPEEEVKGEFVNIIIAFVIMIAIFLIVIVLIVMIFTIIKHGLF